MYSQKAIKLRARSVLKQHYLLIVILLVAAAFLGTNFSSMLDLFKARNDEGLSATTLGVYKSIVDGDIEGARAYAAGNRDVISGNTFRIGSLEFGHQDGVFSEIINALASGSVFAALAGFILRFTGSPAFVSGVFMLVSFLIMAFKIIFITDTYEVIYTRMCLEARTYKRVDTSTLTYLIRTGTWFNVSLAHFRCEVFKFLWDLTIVGGIIKHYAYSLVPFILAENPAMSGREAMELSQEMMKGHKWERFCLDLSFIGWDLLSIPTCGLLTIFYVAPYKSTTRAEYYVYLRELSKVSDVPGIDMLRDTWLYHRASVEVINNAYSDIIEIMDSPDIELTQPSRLRRFFQNVCSVVLWYDPEEQLYREVSTRKAAIDSYKYCIEGDEYPARLCPTPARRKGISFEHTNYMRHYSVTSLVMIFFTFCLVGWLWEVAIHIYEDGVFVNRGVLHGPWLPIYGVGSLVILMCLAPLRKNPLMEFISAIVLCGVIEYFGSWMLEITKDGQKWWDYTGYFLNINGRICAEGLLVFGIAGVAAVYFIAPMLDNRYSCIPEHKKIVICLILITIFTIDMIYSHFTPNTGEGITDYASVITQLYRVAGLS